MIVKRRQSAEYPIWTEKLARDGYSRVRAVAEWTEPAPCAGCGGCDGQDIERQVIIESQKDLDNLPSECQEVTLMFEDGTYVELPISGFKKMFEIVPEGELTSALYGN